MQVDNDGMIVSNGNWTGKWTTVSGQTVWPEHDASLARRPPAVCLSLTPDQAQKHAHGMLIY